MSNFGKRCLGGKVGCTDDVEGRYYAAAGDYPHAHEQEGVALYSGGGGGSAPGFFSEDIDTSVGSRATYYNDATSHHSYPPQQYKTYASDQTALVPLTASNAGALTDAAAPAIVGFDGESHCQCEYLMFDNFKWTKQRHYVVVKDGREYYDRYVVTYRKRDSNAEYDMFTYKEGVVHNGRVEEKFKYLCGEALAVHDLPPVNSLKGVCYFTPPSVDPKAPFHVQEEVCNSRSLTAVPLKIIADHQVLITRTYNNALALQLMPTAYSERTILSGTPLFQGVKKSICAAVGNMFSEFYYVINGSPCSYALFSIGPREKGDHAEGDRMRVVMLDRRDRVDSEEWTTSDTVLNSVADVAYIALQRFAGKEARLDARDILYVGVVNSNMQLTDAPYITKKYKPPKSAVVVVIDNHGVYAAQIRDKEIVAQWVQKDANVNYSVLPRNYFDKPRSSVLRINTADTNAKMRRAKSKEVLI